MYMCIHAYIYIYPKKTMMGKMLPKCLALCVHVNISDGSNGHVRVKADCVSNL